MDKKYKLLKDDYINYRGRTLYRIKALKDFGNVKAGDIGGYIEKEENLSHNGECWVYNNAKVFDNAEVFGSSKVFNNAWVYEDARVYGNAKIFGNVEVYGSAKILGNARVYISAQVYGNAHISGNAEVYDNAQVFGDATIYDNAAIFGRAEIFNKAQIYDNAKVYGNAKVYDNAKVYNNAKVFDNAHIYKNAIINHKHIIGRVSMSFKDIFQYQCENRMLIAILTEDDRILYSIGCQHNITEEEFIYRIHNKDGGLKENPHRAEYLKLIQLINLYFGGE